MSNTSCNQHYCDILKILIYSLKEEDSLEKHLKKMVSGGRKERMRKTMKKREQNKGGESKRKGNGKKEKTFYKVIKFLINL